MEKTFGKLQPLFSTGIYLKFLMQKTNFNIKDKLNLNLQNIVLAIGCAVAFYLILDCFLDPMIEKAFPVSEKSYQETLNTLKQGWITSAIHICIIAPLTEEILMRGFVLDSLKKRHGVGLALLVSTLIFAFLHFNMVQTLSACISGLILGLLYLKTNSLFSTILAHALYNTISFIMIFIM